jgi:glycerophosphoryl diester phosphodiesterase
LHKNKPKQVILIFLLLVVFLVDLLAEILKKRNYFNSLKMKKTVVTILALVLLYGCNIVPKNGNKAVVNIDKQGHRGCRGLLPENTIPGFLKAIDLGVNTLEMDVVFTKDQQAILSHEAFFNHEITTLANGEFVSEINEKELNIYKMEYAETMQFDVGQKPHPRFSQQLKIPAHKPLLADVIEIIERYAKTNAKKPLFYNIETKTTPQTDAVFHPKVPQFVDLLMATIFEKRIEKRVIIQSFDIRTLQYLHQKYPKIKTALLIENFDKRAFSEQIADLGFLPTIYSPAYELVTQKLVETCKMKRVKIIPWTVNDIETINRLKKMGVNGIITDYPNLL